MKARLGCAPCQGGAFQWVQVPPGDSLQSEAIGAVMEVTKWLKPSMSVSRWELGRSTRFCGVAVAMAPSYRSKGYCRSAARSYQ